MCTDIDTDAHGLFIKIKAEKFIDKGVGFIIIKKLCIIFL